MEFSYLDLFVTVWLMFRYKNKILLLSRAFSAVNVHSSSTLSSTYALEICIHESESLYRLRFCPTIHIRIFFPRLSLMKNHKTIPKTVIHCISDNTQQCFLMPFWCSASIYVHVCVHTRARTHTHNLSLSLSLCLSLSLSLQTDSILLLIVREKMSVLENHLVSFIYLHFSRHVSSESVWMKHLYHRTVFSKT